jgi:hypothetical protein
MIPGAVAIATLTREGMASQAADGTPVMTRETIWIKNVHYQSLKMYGTDENQTQTGRVARQVYKFWVPYLEGRERPRLNDQLHVDGYSFRVIAIDFEAIRHHMVARAERLER